MPIVIDTSVVVAVAGNEPSKHKLISLVRDQDLLAAATLPWEIGNAITAMFKQKRIALAGALELMAQCRQIPIKLWSPELNRSVELSHRLNVYAYDAYVIQCSLETSSPLITLDGGLAAAAKRAGVIVLETKQ